MWRLDITGDDAWDTMARIMGCLTGWHITLNGRIYEVQGINYDKGEVMLWVLDDDGKRVGEPVGTRAEDIHTIAVL